MTSNPSPTPTPKPTATVTPTPVPTATIAPTPVVTATPAATIRKKGVGAWNYGSTASNSIKDLNVSWYYTWRSSTAGSGIAQPANIQFVPMIWDETMVTSKDLSNAQNAGAGILLGFNEPEITEQANMTVDQALTLWPQLVATGLRIGSPSFAHDPSSPGSWGEQFLNGASQRGYKVDFIAVHWYGTQTDSARMMEALSFVERYAWFSLSKYGTSPSENTYLYTDAGVVTQVGQAYKAVGN